MKTKVAARRFVSAASALATSGLLAIVPAYALPAPSAELASSIGNGSVATAGMDYADAGFNLTEFGLPAATLAAAPDLVMANDDATSPAVPFTLAACQHQNADGTGLVLVPGGRAPDGSTVPMVKDKNGNPVSYAVSADMLADRTALTMALNGDPSQKGTLTTDRFYLPIAVDPDTDKLVVSSSVLVPGDCGQLNLNVTNSGSQIAVLSTYIKAFTYCGTGTGWVDNGDGTCTNPNGHTFTPSMSALPADNPTATLNPRTESINFYNELKFAVLARNLTDWTEVSATSMAPKEYCMLLPDWASNPNFDPNRPDDPAFCGFQMAGDRATELYAAPNPRNANNPVPINGRLIDQQCVLQGQTTQVGVTYDFPYDPSNPNSGGNTPFTDIPSVNFQLYLKMDEAAGNSVCPNLQVAVSKAMPDAAAQQVSWTVQAQNAAKVATIAGTTTPLPAADQPTASNTNVYLIIDGRNPDDWYSGVAAKVCMKVTDTNCLVRNPATGKPYFTDINHSDKQLLIWHIGDLGPGQVAPTLKITIPTAEWDSDGDVCVTAYIDSPDDPYVFPAASNQVNLTPGGAPALKATGAALKSLTGKALYPPTATTFSWAANSPSIVSGYSIADLCTLIAPNRSASLSANGPVGCALPSYDWAKHHHTDDPLSYDAGIRNNGLLASDTDAWDYNGWIYVADKVELDHVTDLQVAVTPYRYVRGNITWTVTAANKGDKSAYPVKVLLSVDALSPANTEGARPWGDCTKAELCWYTASRGSVNGPSVGIYKDNNHVVWDLGLMPGGDVQTLTLSVPAADVTWDGDICVTAVIWSPLNDYRKNWSTEAPDARAIIPDSAYPIPRPGVDKNDIDDDNLKGHGDDPSPGNGWLQRNNGNLSGTDCDSTHLNCADIDQWDYNGWYLDNPTDLKVAVSKVVEDGLNLKWTVWAKNAGTLRTQGSDVYVEMAIDALKPGFEDNGIEWGAFDPSQGEVGEVTKGILRENKHVTWHVGHLEPGEEAILEFTIPMQDVTFDGDLCVTAVVYSVMNPYTKHWTTEQIGLRNGPDGVFGTSDDGDIDAPGLKAGALALQRNNNNVDADFDQWDYYGWYYTGVCPPGVPVADLDAEVTVSRQEVYVGEEVTYYFTVKNDGPDAADYATATISMPDTMKIMSVSLPNEFRHEGNTVSGAYGAAVSGRVLRFGAQVNQWNVPYLASGESRTLAVTVRIMVAGDPEISIYVTTDCACDPQTANNLYPKNIEEKSRMAVKVVQVVEEVKQIVPGATRYVAMPGPLTKTGVGLLGLAVAAVLVAAPTLIKRRKTTTTDN